MSNLPPGCSQRDIDIAQGWKPRSECVTLIEEWEWDEEWGRGGGPFTAEHWDELMSLKDSELRAFFSRYDVKELWKQAFPKGPTNAR